ncbi:MAG TPA: chemotaxis-specific protein-glutamate methyltransferase CheB [Kofleriaceae bacterium]
MKKARVLVVDDSAFARTVLAKLMRANADIDVIGSARDGADALEKIAAMDPDVVTLDLTMPEIDGIGVLRALQGQARPRVIVVSMSSVDTELGAEALALGAIDLIAKPTSLASDRLNEIGDELIAKVLAATSGYTVGPSEPAAGANLARPVGEVELVMVGTSTGGPQALTRLLTALPGNLRAPLAMVLHIPVGYTEALAARLDHLSALHVVEASEGLRLVPGMAVLARAGEHLTIVREKEALVARLATRPNGLFMPSVDELFKSGATAVGAKALGVVLTGMGDDGLIGSRQLAGSGAGLLTEAASSCVVYGMPRAVYEAGLGATSVPLERMAEEIARRV